jgi:DinB superfamily
MSDPHKELIKQLKSVLLKGYAHVTLDDALNDIPENLIRVVPGNLPYSIWQLAEHIRISQWDILEFSRYAKHVSPQWPDDYWPKEPGPLDATGWDDCVQQIKDDRNAFIAMLEKKDADLYTPFPWGDGQNLLRGALVIADHNSYHTAEIIVARRLLSDW